MYSSLRRSERREKLRTRVGRVTDEIVSLQAENRQLNAENQALADRFNKLTEYNQVLGDDLANLDAETLYLEHTIEYKRKRLKRYTSRGQTLQSTLAKYRTMLLDDEEISAMVEKIKKIEAMRMNLLRQFQELKGEPIDETLEDAKKEKRNELEILKNHKSDLVQQEELLTMLMDPDISARKKKERLGRLIREKEKEEQDLLDQIEEIKEENMANLRRKKLSSEGPIDSEAGIDEEEKEYHEQQRIKLLQKDPETYDAMERKMKEECGDHDQSESESSQRRPHSRHRRREERSKSRASSKRHKEEAPEKERQRKRASTSVGRRSRSASRSSERHRSPSPVTKEPIEEEVVSEEPQYPPPQDDDREYVKRCMKVLDPKLAVHIATQTMEEGEDELLVTQEKVKTLSQQKTESQIRLNRLMDELVRKSEEKKEAQNALKELLPKCTTTQTFATSIAPDPNAAVDLSLKLFDRHSKCVGTDLTGVTIDFHMKILEEQTTDLANAVGLEARIEKLKKQVKAAGEKVDSERETGETKDLELQQAKSDLKSATTELDRDQINEDLEIEMTRQMHEDIADLSQRIRERQRVLDELTARNEAEQAKLEDLVRKRESYERDVEDMAQREKPEIQTLTHQVQASRSREKESKETLEAVEESLREKRSRLQDIMTSDELREYNDMIIRRMKLERRLNKWQMLAKCARDTVQGLEAYSIENRQKRKALAKSLEQCQKSKMAKEEELRKVELYAELLTDLIRAHTNNWI